MISVHNHSATHNRPAPKSHGQQTMSKYLSMKYLLISKKDTAAKAVQKIDFWGVCEQWYPQTMSKHLSVEYLVISKKKQAP